MIDGRSPVFGNRREQPIVFFRRPMCNLYRRPPTVVRHLYIDGAAAPPRSSQLPAAPRAPRVRA
ncbi:hypothetical protein MSG28_012834 [Choristoneura fumiferana]|uniref:Uncharacterized protein n=1 Tax=Choristoneura fumiferana TaxID=7141 RepID=A0ACC0JID4_CHOFU|nr:hypothetical protein MSG28_012834 [Choristoneura fumiferana]